MILEHDLVLTTPCSPRPPTPTLDAFRRRFLIAIGLASVLAGCDTLFDKCEATTYEDQLTSRYYLSDDADTCPELEDDSAFDGNSYDFSRCTDITLTDDSEPGWCIYDVVCPEMQTTGFVYTDDDASCPELSSGDQLDYTTFEYNEQLNENYGDYYGLSPSGDCSDITLTGQNGVICTYEMTCTVSSCCYGRPYFDDTGETVLPEVTTDSPAWRTALAAGAVALTDDERALLADYWLRNARAEHSSVAGFHRFALDLLAHGAPPELLLGAQEAASQEVQHAVDAFSLASRYAGKPLGPAPLRLGQSAPIAQTLAELVAWTIRDGAIGETMSAYLASEARRHATDPVICDKLDTVIRDELAHAELAWKTLRWALAIGGAPVRQAIMAGFSAPLQTHFDEIPRSAALLAHGMLPGEDLQAAAERCYAALIQPVAASLLAQELAA